MKVRLHLSIESAAGHIEEIQEVITLERPPKLTPERVGLSLAESKQVLHELQQIPLAWPRPYTLPSPSTRIAGRDRQPKHGQRQILPSRLSRGKEKTKGLARCARVWPLGKARGQR
jgi:hypothetical protein